MAGAPSYSNLEMAVVTQKEEMKWETNPKPGGGGDAAAAGGADSAASRAAASSSDPAPAPGSFFSLAMACPHKGAVLEKGGATTPSAGPAGTRVDEMKLKSAVKLFYDFGSRGIMRGLGFLWALEVLLVVVNALASSGMPGVLLLSIRYVFGGASSVETFSSWLLMYAFAASALWGVEHALSEYLQERFAHRAQHLLLLEAGRNPGGATQDHLHTLLGSRLRQTRIVLFQLLPSVAGCAIGAAAGLVVVFVKSPALGAVAVGSLGLIYVLNLVNDWYTRFEMRRLHQAIDSIEDAARDANNSNNTSMFNMKSVADDLEALHRAKVEEERGSCLQVLTSIIGRFTMNTAVVLFFYLGASWVRAGQSAEQEAVAAAAAAAADTADAEAGGDYASWDLAVSFVFFSWAVFCAMRCHQFIHQVLINRGGPLALFAFHIDRGSTVFLGDFHAEFTAKSKSARKQRKKLPRHPNSSGSAYSGAGGDGDGDADGDAAAAAAGGCGGRCNWGWVMGVTLTLLTAGCTALMVYLGVNSFGMLQCSKLQVSCAVKPGLVGGQQALVSMEQIFDVQRGCQPTVPAPKVLENCLVEVLSAGQAEDGEDNEPEADDNDDAATAGGSSAPSNATTSNTTTTSSSGGDARSMAEILLEGPSTDLTVTATWLSWTGARESFQGVVPRASVTAILAAAEANAAAEAAAGAATAAAGGSKTVRRLLRQQQEQQEQRRRRLASAAVKARANLQAGHTSCLTGCIDPSLPSAGTTVESTGTAEEDSALHGRVAAERCTVDVTVGGDRFDGARSATIAAQVNGDAGMSLDSEILGKGWLKGETKKPVIFYRSKAHLTSQAVGASNHIGAVESMTLVTNRKDGVRFESLGLERVVARYALRCLTGKGKPYASESSCNRYGGKRGCAYDAAAKQCVVPFSATNTPLTTAAAKLAGNSDFVVVHETAKLQFAMGSLLACTGKKRAGTWSCSVTLEPTPATIGGGAGDDGSGGSACATSAADPGWQGDAPEVTSNFADLVKAEQAGATVPPIVGPLPFSFGTLWVDRRQGGAVRFEYVSRKDCGNYDRHGAFRLAPVTKLPADALVDRDTGAAVRTTQRDSTIARSTGLQQFSTKAYPSYCVGPLRPGPSTGGLLKLQPWSMKGLSRKQQKDQCDSRISWDRGHMIPANHWDHDKGAIKESNYMINILPQVDKLNRGAWLETEMMVECLRDVEPVRVLGGAVYTTTGENGEVDRYLAEAEAFFDKSHGVKMPTYFWKLIVGKADGHYAADSGVQAFWMPNIREATAKKIDEYVVSVTQLEANLLKHTGRAESFSLSASIKSHVPDKAWKPVSGCNRGRR